MYEYYEMNNDSSNNTNYNNKLIYGYRYFDNLFNFNFNKATSYT